VRRRWSRELFAAKRKAAQKRARDQEAIGQLTDAKAIAEFKKRCGSAQRCTARRFGGVTARLLRSMLETLAKYQAKRARTHARNKRERRRAR
jgi:hypothetical protein